MGGRGASSGSTNRQFDGSLNLQGIGEVKGYKVENLKKGDILMWNNGYTSKVVSITPSKSGKSYTLKEKSSETGKEGTRTVRAGRILGIAKKEVTDERLRSLRITGMANHY